MKTKRYTHLRIEERTMIELKLEQGLTLRAIARSVKRSPSSISRELKRNGWHRSEPQRVEKKPGRARLPHYQAVQAQQRAGRLAQTGPLWASVERLLRERHSPEQIAGMLHRMNPDEPLLQASHETIYTALYSIPRGALRTELLACLRQAHKNRRPRARGEDRRSRLPDQVSIHDRPAEIDERLIPGHWEGDLIKGAGNASSIGTLVERTSLFVTLVKMENATAQATVTAFSTVLNRIDAQRRLSMTYDQGREMAQHTRLTELTGVKVYFADPHSPWQRGRNENTNGLLRQYLPKGTDLSVFSQAQLDDIAWSLNTRPRKSLGWKCPAELFMPDSFDFFEHYHHIRDLKNHVALRP